MKLEQREEIFNQAKKWVLEAGSRIRENINEPMTVDIKSNRNDLVTTMDKETELFFSDNIRSKYPEHFLVSEEGYGDDLSSLDGTVWIVDPIDGTMNFVHQKRNFAISVGIYHDGIGEIGLIYDVMDDILYEAKKNEGAYRNGVKLQPLTNNKNLESSILALNHRWLCENSFMDERVMQSLVTKVRGSRTYGSAALEFAYVAEGILDGYIAMRLAPWDVAAGIVIVNEVGGVTTNGAGQPVNMLQRNLILTCNDSLHKTIINDFLQKGKK